MSARKQRRQLYTPTPTEASSRQSSLWASWTASKGFQRPVKQEGGKYWPRGAFPCRPQFSHGVEACSPPARVGAQPLVSGAAELTVSTQCRACCLKLSGAPQRSHTGCLLLLTHNALGQRSSRYCKRTSNLQPGRQHRTADELLRDQTRQATGARGRACEESA